MKTVVVWKSKRSNTTCVLFIHTHNWWERFESISLSPTLLIPASICNAEQQASTQEAGRTRYNPCPTSLFQPDKDSRNANETSFFPAAAPHQDLRTIFHCFPASLKKKRKEILKVLKITSILHCKYRIQKSARDHSSYLEKHVLALETQYLLQSTGTLQKARNPVLSGTKLLGNHLSYSGTVIKSLKLWDELIPQVTESKALTFNTSRY